jgi:sodium/hydrogen exchanger 8
MALFFNGVVLSHYNSYNLSATAQTTTEQFFATVATTMESIVFLYMGMGVFLDGFRIGILCFPCWVFFSVSLQEL